VVAVLGSHCISWAVLREESTHIYRMTFVVEGYDFGFQIYIMLSRSEMF